MPIGSIVMWPGDTAPDGWLLCDGTTYKRNDFENLFNVIGNKYNNGVILFDSFKVPNLQSRFPLGASSEYTLGKMDGESTHELTEAEMPPHSHQLTEIIGSKATGSGWAGVNFSTGDGKIEHFDFPQGVTGARFPKTEKTGGEITINNMIPEVKAKAHNNMPPYLVVNFIIKYK